jgi:hypothetical protein
MAKVLLRDALGRGSRAQASSTLRVEMARSEKPRMAAAVWVVLFTSAGGRGPGAGGLGPWPVRGTVGPIAAACAAQEQLARLVVLVPPERGESAHPSGCAHDVQPTDGSAASVNGSPCAIPARKG